MRVLFPRVSLVFDFFLPSLTSDVPICSPLAALSAIETFFSLFETQEIELSLRLPYALKPFPRRPLDSQPIGRQRADEPDFPAFSFHGEIPAFS